MYRSHTIPFISLGKLDYILLDSFIGIAQPTTKVMSHLRRRAVPAQLYEIDYLRLIQFYQRKYQQDDHIVLNQQQEQLLININGIQKYVNENEFIMDMLLTQYQQSEYRKLRKQIEITEKQSNRKPTKRKASAVMMERQHSIAER